MSRPALTRRGLVQAGAAAFGVVGLSAGTSALADAIAGPAPDAALFGLIERHAAAQTAFEATLPARNDAFDAALRAYPPRPAALFSGFGDHLHDLGGAHGHAVDAGGRRRSYFDHDDIRRLREASPLTAWHSPDDETPSPRIPDPVGEARRRQIIEAHDAWEVERTAVADRVGYTAATAANEAACGALNDAEGAVMALPARTVAGLAAKAAWIVAQVERGAMENVPDDFAIQVAAFGGVAS